jgi:anti-sigma B factor antagonist
MTSGSTWLEVTTLDGVLRVGFLQRSILDEGCIQEIGQELGGLIEDLSPPRMVLDFTSVEHLSSAALGMLITLNSRIKDAGGGLSLAAIRPDLLEIFEITKLNRLFDLRSTVDEAMSGLSDAN